MQKKTFGVLIFRYEFTGVDASVSNELFIDTADKF